MKTLLSVTACLLAALSACSSAEPEYYTLSSVAGHLYTDKTVMVKVRRPVIPLTLDRPEMVSKNGEFRIHEHENRLWSEPLDTMIERILADDLRTRLNRSTVVTESSGISIKAAYILDVDIQQFGTDENGNAILQAQGLMRRQNEKDIALPVMLHGPRATPGEPMAKALSILLGEFADNAASALNH